MPVAVFHRKAWKPWDEFDWPTTTRPSADMP
jgi:hypothetical protein